MDARTDDTIEGSPEEELAIFATDNPNYRDILDAILAYRNSLLSRPPENGMCEMNESNQAPAPVEEELQTHLALFPDKSGMIGRALKEIQALRAELESRGGASGACSPGKNR